MDHQRAYMQSTGARPIHNQRESFSESRHPNGTNGFSSTNGPMPVPTRPPGINGHGNGYGGMNGHGNGHGNGYGGRGHPAPTAGNGFMSKSPPSAPNQKNTKHVPCKFFYKGQCAAGDTCPYSHNPEPPSPCKFFINGNCKYGNNCALPHYGTQGQLLNPNSLAQYKRRMRGLQGQQQHQGGGEMFTPQQAPLDRHIPYGREYGGDYGSPTGSNFGSPPYESQFGRSPPFRSALDAPLPPSFSSQDLPNIQKFGPNAMSVPSRGGLGPLTSMSPTVSIAGRDTFGNPSMALHERIDKLDLGSSPPSTNMAAPRRIVPTSRMNNQSILSRDFPASLPVRDRNELFGSADRRVLPEDSTNEEDYVPAELSHLLTPQQKMRRFSRSQDESGLDRRPSHGSLVGSPTSKVGSPSGASPSRFSGFFAEQARREAGAQLGSSPFGHVGSPLRNSSFPSSITKQQEVGSHSPSFGPISPPGFSKERPSGVSSLSEQLRKARNPAAVAESQAALKEPAPPAFGQAPRSVSGPAVSMPVRKERVLSSGSGQERIDEEDPCFFSMEDEKAQ